MESEVKANGYQMSLALMVPSEATVEAREEILAALAELLLASSRGQSEGAKEKLHDEPEADE
jgi:hypothetical protein